MLLSTDTSNDSDEMMTVSGEYEREYVVVAVCVD
jgi:hypothetical protein